MQTRPKVLSIVGATASGKTGLALLLAKQFNWEIVSADSRQVYVGLDIGSGKEGTLKKIQMTNDKFQIKYPFVRYLEDVPQWLIDIADPKERFTVANWQAAAYEVIEDILKRGKMPIVVGGTGLYINALFEGYVFSDSVPRDENNPRHAASTYQEKNPPDWDVLTLGIDHPREELYKRIDERVDSRIDAGMVAESERLLAEGIEADRLRKFGLEYRFVADFIEHKIPENDFAQSLKYAIHSYARRQLTWFRRHGDVIWVKSSDGATNQVNNFIK